MIEEMKKVFNVELVTGKNFNEIIFLLNDCKNIDELKNTWQLFNDDLLFKNLDKTQKELVIEVKDKLKKKFLKKQK